MDRESSNKANLAPVLSTSLAVLDRIDGHLALGINEIEAAQHYLNRLHSWYVELRAWCQGPRTAPEPEIPEALRLLQPLDERGQAVAALKMVKQYLHSAQQFYDDTVAWHDGGREGPEPELPTNLRKAGEIS